MFMLCLKIKRGAPKNDHFVSYKICNAIAMLSLVLGTMMIKIIISVFSFVLAITNVVKMINKLLEQTRNLALR